MGKSRFSTLTSGRFFWLLIAIVTTMVLATFTPPGAAGKWESAVPLVGILIACSYAARGGEKRLLATLLLTGLFVVTGALYIFHPGPATQFLCFGMLLVCLVFSLLSTLSFVLSSGVIGPDHIYGAICAYVLIAMCFATIYTIQVLAIPSAFNGVQTLGPNARTFEEMLYFSFTTLSTVGYGDITPVHRSARAVCSVEMLTGTFYVAILIARLAGLYPPRSNAE
jgi:Ion channel